MFDFQKRPLEDRMQQRKTGKKKQYYAMSLRLDLVELLEAGLERCGKTQRQLAEMSGYKSESYISRLANANTDFKIGAAARILIPLGIRPKLVDSAEWDRLKSIVERSVSVVTSAAENVTESSEITTAPQSRTDNGRRINQVSRRKETRWATGIRSDEAGPGRAVVGWLDVCSEDQRGGHRLHVYVPPTTA